MRTDPVGNDPGAATQPTTTPPPSHDAVTQCSQYFLPVTYGRRSQDFVWGARFSIKKVDDQFFSRRPSKDGRKLLNEPLHSHLQISSAQPKMS